MRKLLLILIILNVHAFSYEITAGFNNYCRKEIPDKCEVFTWYGDKYSLGKGYYNIGMYSGYRIHDGCEAFNEPEFNEFNSVDFYILIKVSRKELKKNPPIMIKYNFKRRKVCEIFKLD